MATKNPTSKKSSLQPTKTPGVEAAPAETSTGLPGTRSGGGTIDPPDETEEQESGEEGEGTDRKDEE